MDATGAAAVGFDLVGQGDVAFVRYARDPSHCTDLLGKHNVDSVRAIRFLEDDRFREKVSTKRSYSERHPIVARAESSHSRIASLIGRQAP